MCHQGVKCLQSVFETCHLPQLTISEKCSTTPCHFEWLRIHPCPQSPSQVLLWPSLFVGYKHLTLNLNIFSFWQHLTASVYWLKSDWMIAYCLYVPGKILDPNHKFNQNCGFWILSVDLSVHNQYSDQSRKTGQCCCMSSSIVTLMITDDSLQRMLILLSPNPRIFYSCWNHMYCHFFFYAIVNCHHTRLCTTRSCKFWCYFTLFW